ncbi:LptF/LptG family permease [bacterium]|nr:LptF/LptG family permease [bacterium]
MKSIFKLTRLDKYILKQVLEVFILGVIIFTSIIFASDTFIRLIKQMSMYGMPFNIAFMIIILNLPSVIVMTIPMSCLFSTVMTINKLCLNSEITVMRSCGISIARIAKPIFMFAAVLMLFMVLINETVVPRTVEQSKILMLYSITQRNIPEGKRNFTLKELKDGNKLKRLFYVEECKNSSLKNISVLDVSDINAVQILQAKTGSSQIDGWQFDNASIYTIFKSEKNLSTSWVEKTVVDFGVEIQKQLLQDKDSGIHNFVSLVKLLRNKQDIQPDQRTRLRIEMWDKIAFPLTTVILVLIGIPLAITPPRVRYNRGFLFSILIIFLYYLIRAFSYSLGEAGTITPILASWSPNLILFLLGTLLFYKKACKI